jgi:uncharacterized protein
MPPEPGLHYIVKLASRCNLNCSYCYVYNQADSSWRDRPALMSDETFAATIERVRRHCERSGQTAVDITFHGGEPTLIGPERFARICALARDRLRGVVEPKLAIQTNGTRLDHRWIEVLRAHDVKLGISLDGPQEIQDRFRVYRTGRGSHDRVARGIAMVNDAALPFGILSVVQPGADPLRIHRHFLELGPRAISYLLPNETHETVGPIRERYGPTPCADFLIPIFDDWWFNGSIEVSIREFRNLARVILGGESRLEVIGAPPLRFAVVDTDGSIHGHDNLRSCEDGLSETGLNVHDADFSQLADTSPFHASIMDGLPLPTGCRGCPESDTCAGGQLPNRYSKARGFDNPSVWCADLLALFAHVRMRLGVSPEETRTRRLELRRRREQTRPSLAGAPQ